VSLVRPLPDVRPGDEPMWEGLHEGVLRLQVCSACAHVRYPPGPVCPACLDPGSAWVAMGGGGTVLSWVTFRRQYFAGMPPPYVVVAGWLDEGPIVVADLVGDPRSLTLDLRVRLDIGPAQFEDGTTRALYRWRLDGGDDDESVRGSHG
jgi:uncharacterized protein